jgi:hypothetical protein
MTTVRCTCGETYHADEQHAGRRIRCRCGKVLNIVAAPNPRELAGSQELGPSSRTPVDRAPEAHPRRVSKPTALRWVVAASVAGSLLLSWGVYRIANPPQEKKSSASVRLPPPAIPAPVATVQPVLPPCSPETQFRPRSGAELGGRPGGGLGRLRVANGTDSDAVAVLIDDATEGPRRAIFIRSGESGAMTSVPPGR